MKNTNLLYVHRFIQTLGLFYYSEYVIDACNGEGGVLSYCMDLKGNKNLNKNGRI